MSDLAGKVVVITGGNSGIGKETAVELARMGARVVIAARNPTRAAAAVKEIKERTGAGDRVETMPLDLASFASVRAFAGAFTDAHDRLDVLVNNAGGWLGKRIVTADGHESQFQVNHLSHFLLTNLLRERLVRSAPARVVNIASVAHKNARRGLDFDDLDYERRRYRGFRVYSETKLMNILFARELARRWDGTGVSANAVHPGFVATNFAREGDVGWWGNIGMPLTRPFSISVQQGAVTPVYVASSPDVEGITGQYFVKCRVAGPSRAALDDDAAARLWEISAKLTGAS
ncbi:MAG TPA: SDR family oxidoreductase [Acidimicrobiia bacterium]|nr:SDR family oxidoreductase [Acidimicrobiia bacterium]